MFSTFRSPTVILFTFPLIVTRIQFYAIEIARNRRGLNKPLLEKSSDAQPSAQESQGR